MRGAPHRGVAAAIFLTRAAISARMGGRPPVGRPERWVQYSRKRRRCHRRTVSGETMTRAWLAPAGPDSCQPDPQQAVDRAELRAGQRPLVDAELLAQGQVLEGELAMAAEEEREEPEQVEQKCEHRAEIVAGSEPTDQPLAGRTRYWRRTGSRRSP
jgi:hypothetical protein